uniref:Uncharacterized protein n=1 Tax=Vibrio parahaemolyticus TaxID=670 RepID=A0A0C5GXM6_VIBPH|nr:hypothetical protein pVPH1_0215 [Vibrio parahaemolyticus]
MTLKPLLCLNAALNNVQILCISKVCCEVTNDVFIHRKSG